MRPSNNLRGYPEAERMAMQTNRRLPHECWEWTGSRNPAGYGQIYAFGRRQAAHRVAYILAHGDIPEGMFICHKCDNPPCVNPAHLWLGTPADNTKDRDQKGRRKSPIGERHKLAKLKKSDVLEIIKSTKSRRELAEIYGVRWVTVWEIQTGRSWRHLHDEGANA